MPPVIIKVVKKKTGGAMDGKVIELLFESANNSTIFTNTGLNTNQGIISAGSPRVRTSPMPVSSGSGALNNGGVVVLPMHRDYTLGSRNFTLEVDVFMVSRHNAATCPVSGNGWNINLGNLLYNGKSWFSHSQQTASHWGGNGPGWGTLPLGVWCRLTLCRSGTKLYTFLDGVPAGSTIVAAGQNLGGTLTDDSAIYVGCTYAFVDNFRLTMGEALYTEGTTYNNSANKSSHIDFLGTTGTLAGVTRDGDRVKWTSTGGWVCSKQLAIPKDGNWWYFEAEVSNNVVGTQYIGLGHVTPAGVTSYSSELTIAQTDGFRGIAVRWYNNRFNAVEITRTGTINANTRLAGDKYTNVFPAIRSDPNVSGNIVRLLPYGFQHSFAPNIAAWAPGNPLYQAPCYPLIS